MHKTASKPRKKPSANIPPEVRKAVKALPARQDDAHPRKTIQEVLAERERNGALYRKYFVEPRRQKAGAKRAAQGRGGE